MKRAWTLLTICIAIEARLDNRTMLSQFITSGVAGHQCQLAISIRLIMKLLAKAKHPA